VNVRRAELLLDGREIAPDVLARYLAVAELEDVEQAEAHLAASTAAMKLTPVRDVTVPDGLVDHEAVRRTAGAPV
jgi:hypothetical protein